MNQPPIAMEERSVQPDERLVEIVETDVDLGNSARGDIPMA
jgi:hypothetical protein